MVLKDSKTDTHDWMLMKAKQSVTQSKTYMRCTAGAMILSMPDMQFVAVTVAMLVFVVYPAAP